MLGNSIYSISTVVAAYMAGLGIGALIAGTFVSPLTYPIRTYGVIEGIIGTFGVASPFLFKLLHPFFSHLFFLQEVSHSLFLIIRFIVVFGILLIPTIAMGMTLPILVSGLSAKRPIFGSLVGRLYGWNTAGAVLGAIAAGFLLLPSLGLFKTIMFASTLNFAILVMIYVIPPLRTWQVLPKSGGKTLKKTTTGAESPEGKLFRHSGKVILFLFACSGFLTLVYEVGWTRILTPIIGSSVYSFTIILATFLLGIAIGSLVIARWAEGMKKPFLAFGIFEILLGIIALAGTFSFHYLPELFVSIIQKSDFSITWIVLGEFFLSGFISFLPCLLMGFLFPIASCAYRKSEPTPGRNIAHIYFFNTSGAIFGSLITGFILVPKIGILKTLIMTSLLSVAIGIIALIVSEATRRTKLLSAGIVLSLSIVLALFVPSWDINLMNRGLIQVLRDIKAGDPSGGLQKKGQILFHKEGKNATVAVSFVGKDIYLKIAGKVDASAVKDATTQILCAQLPLLYAEHPVDVCIVGLGSGITTHSVLTHPVQSVDTIEIEEAVVDASKYFTVVNQDPLSDPRSKIIIDDARNYLSYVDKKYDVIISEPSNPWIAGINSLFTHEFYDIVHEKLVNGGVFSQWIQTYELSAQSFATILRTLNSNFPHCHFYFIPESGDTLLIASKGKLALSFRQISAFFKNREVSEDLKRIDILNPFDLSTFFVAPLSDIVAAFGEGPYNTDDNSYIEYKAPFELLRQSKSEYRLAVGQHLIEETRVTLFSDLDEKQAFLGMSLSSLKRNDEVRMDLILARLKNRHFEREVSQLISAIQEKEREKEKERLAYRLFKKADESLKKRQYDLASRYTQEALNLKPDLDDLSFNSALLLLTIGKLEEAEKVFKSILERKPFGYTYASFLNLGSIYWNRNQLKKGMAYYEEAVRYNPYLANGYIQTANAYKILGNPDKARTLLIRALELEPTNERARELLETL